MSGVHITWRHAVFVVVALIGASLVASYVFDLGRPEFTDEEKTLLHELEGNLDGLLLSEREASRLLGVVLFDCTDDENYYGAVDYDTDPRDDASVDVKKAKPTEGHEDVRADGQICGEDGVTYISSVVSLKRDKEDQLQDLRITLELARNKEEDLESVVRPLALFQADAAGGKVLAVNWLEVGLVSAGWGYVVRVRYPDGHEESLYDFDFDRSVVGAGISIWLPTTVTSEDDALSIAHAFDEKVRARLESLSVTTQAR